MQCCKNWMHPQFTLYTSDNNPLLKARKSWCHCNSYYSIYESGRQVGQLRGNFGGTHFQMFSIGELGRQLLAAIHYTTKCSCMSAHRQMEVYVKANGESVVDSNIGVGGHLRLVSKKPQWNERKQRYSMSFKGKKPIPSVKNMILIQEQLPQNYKMVFYKVDSHRFDLEACSPLSPLACMGILLTSFDFKLFVQ